METTFVKLNFAETIKDSFAIIPAIVLSIALTLTVVPLPADFYCLDSPA